MAVPLDTNQKPPAAGQAGQTLITKQLFQHKHARVTFSGGGGLEREERSQLWNPERSPFRRKRTS